MSSVFGMNAHEHFLLLAGYAAIVVFVFILPIWFSWDMRSILKWSQRKNELSIEGQWKDLEDHFERATKSWRPFVWLHRRYLIPGNTTVQFALFLNQHGRDEEALVQVDKAIRQIEGKPRIFKSIHCDETFKTLCSALRTRTLVLGALGRYEEAREAATHLQQLIGTDRRNNSLALLEYYCGNLDEALALAQASAADDRESDAMRGLIALIHTLKGEFDEALQALSYEPADLTRFSTPANLKALSEIPEGASWIESRRKKLVGIFPPAQQLKLARVYLTQEEFDKAVSALNEAEKSLGPNPGLQAVYCHYRAESFAALGKADEAENYIERMRAIVKQTPKRQLRRETHSATGRSYLYLQKFGEALAELTQAHQLALHPIEKHTTAYWLARAHEAAGDRNETMRYYQIVAADPIPSWMRKRAIETLAQQKS